MFTHAPFWQRELIGFVGAVVAMAIFWLLFIKLLQLPNQSLIIIAVGYASYDHARHIADHLWKEIADHLWKEDENG